MTSKVPDIYRQSTLRKLYGKINYYSRLLSENPMMGMVEPYTEAFPIEYRRIVIKPYFKLIYYIYGNIIYLRDLWDTRQDPDVLKEQLK